MYALGSFAFVPPTTTPQAPVASIIVPDQAALGRMPTATVPAPIAYAAIPNQLPNASAAPRAPRAGGANTPAGAEPETTSPPLAGRLSSFPSLFLAQLLGQEHDAEADTIAQSYEQFFFSASPAQADAESSAASALSETFMRIAARA